MTANPNCMKVLTLRQTASQVGISSTYLAMVMVNVIARPTLQISCLDGRLKEGEDSNWEGCGKKGSFLLSAISISELTRLGYCLNTHSCCYFQACPEGVSKYISIRDSKSISLGDLQYSLRALLL